MTLNFKFSNIIDKTTRKGVIRLQMSLKALRVNAGLTQQDVADRLGVSRQSIINWENDEEGPKELVIYALAYLYKTDIDNMRIPS